VAGKPIQQFISSRNIFNTRNNDLLQSNKKTLIDLIREWRESMAEPIE